MKAERFKVTLTFETIANDEKEAYGNAWEVVHDIGKLSGTILGIEKIERSE